MLRSDWFRNGLHTYTQMTNIQLLKNTSYETAFIFVHKDIHTYIHTGCPKKKGDYHLLW